MWPARKKRGVLLLESNRLAWLPAVTGDLLEVREYAAAIEGDGNPMLGLGEKFRQLRAAAGKIDSHEVIDVLLADHWLTWMTLPWSPELPGSPECQLLFKTYFASLLGAESELDTLKYVEAATAYRAPRIVAGVEEAILSEIAGIEVLANVRIRSVRPLSTAVWEGLSGAVAAKDYVCALISAGTAHLLVVQNGRLLHLSQARAGGVLELESAWTRLQLREPSLSGIQYRCFIDLETGSASEATPSNWINLAPRTKPDLARWRGLLLRYVARRPRHCLLDCFERPPASKSVQRFALALGGLLIGSSVTAVAWQHGVTAHAEKVRANERAIAPVARMLSAVDQKRLVGKIKVVNAAVRELNTPVEDLLRAANPPAEGQIALLGMDFRAADGPSETGRLIISAEARASEDMASYVEHLAATAPLVAASLTHHEMIDAGSRPTIRFTVDVDWRQ